MFYILSKILGPFAVPSNIAVTLAAFGVVLLFTRFRRTGRALATLGVALLLVVELTPVGNALMLPLEQRFPPWDTSRGAPTGIIVLGSAIGPELSAARGTPVVGGPPGRIIGTVVLARQYPQARIVYSGVMESDYAIELFESLGIARSRIVAERQSRNTIENAEFSKELIQPKPGERWLLVTSASHMPRAIGAFRRVGFPVEAYPVDWQTRGLIDLLLPGSLDRTDAAAHEWIGLVAYWMTGHTSKLFPAP